jgi:hypothetical protein
MEIQFYHRERGCNHQGRKTLISSTEIHSCWLLKEFNYAVKYVVLNFCKFLTLFGIHLRVAFKKFADYNKSPNFKVSSCHKRAIISIGDDVWTRAVKSQQMVDSQKQVPTKTHNNSKKVATALASRSSTVTQFGSFVHLLTCKTTVQPVVWWQGSGFLVLIVVPKIHIFGEE